jgi:predicted protein tyrosine phosphatase
MLNLPEIHICGIHNLSAMVKTFQPDYVISISDSSGHTIQQAEAGLAEYEGARTMLRFEDIEQVLERFLAPSLADGKLVKNAVDEHQPKRILAHCALGLSRSPAMMMLALGRVANLKSVDDPDAMPFDLYADQIFTAVEVASPQMMPNKRIMEIGCHINGHLGRALRQRNLDYLKSLELEKQEPFSW